MNADYTGLQLRNIAHFHRLLLWSLLVAVIANLTRFTIGDNVISIVVLLVAVGFQVFALYNLSKALRLGTGSIILLIVGLFIPVVGLLILLFMHDKAMKAMKAAGIPVGFMGADPNSIQ
ncbi:MAG TPA: hypothetical protein V6C78_01570 [Crinalium sp.]|jgi:hypothetical protein